MPELLVLLLLQVTIFSSVTALILIAVKQIFKCRIPPHIGVILWIILLARLICPIFPESKVSVYNLIPAGKDIMYTLINDVSDELTEQEEIYASEHNPYVVHRTSDDESAVSEDTPMERDNDTLTVGEYLADVVIDSETALDAQSSADKVNAAILTVYAGGIIVSLTWMSVMYHKAKKRAYLSSYLCEDERLLGIYHKTAEKFGITGNKIPPLRCGISSMVVGCVSPQIVCREDMDEKEAAMVFAHELIHYKYHDNPILLLSTTVACLFWYNPLIWIVRNMLRDDVEVLCDTRTLTYLKIPPTEYAYLLCRSSAFAELAVGAGCHMSASGRRLKKRLRTISFEKHKRFLPKFASVILCAAIMMVCLTNPIVSQNSDYSVYIENYAELTGGDERAMHISEKETVSSYLEQVTTLMQTLLADSGGYLLSSSIGNGSLENFKRICASSEYVSKELASSVKNLRADETLTGKNCVIINDCIAAIIERNNAELEPEIALLPQMITEGEMQTVLANLTEAEQEALLACYNKGVRGADVGFSYIYTEPMMKLIYERINDDWLESKLRGFYLKMDITESSKVLFEPRIREVLDSVEYATCVYVCDATVTEFEENTLRQIIGAAAAGQQENVYYLKQYEDTCTFDTAERIFKSGGFTVERMLAGYAEIGESIEREYTGMYVFPTVRDDSAMINTAVVPEVKDAVQRVYSLGLIDVGDDGMIDLTEHLSCGQGICYAYKLVSSLVGVR